MTDQTAAKTRTVYNADWTSGQFIEYSNGIEFRSDWGNGTIFDDEEEARAEFNRLADDLPAAWRVEFDCSGRIFSGGFGAMLTREVWELDEDGELYDLLECETLDMAVWDGAEWVNC